MNMMLILCWLVLTVSKTLWPSQPSFEDLCIRLEFPLSFMAPSFQINIRVVSPASVMVSSIAIWFNLSNILDQGQTAQRGFAGRGPIILTQTEPNPVKTFYGRFSLGGNSGYELNFLSCEQAKFPSGAIFFSVLWQNTKKISRRAENSV